MFQILKIHWRDCYAIKHSSGEKRVEINQERNFKFLIYHCVESFLTTVYIKYQFVKSNFIIHLALHYDIIGMIDFETAIRNVYRYIL